jgi:hypothetical protein
VIYTDAQLDFNDTSQFRVRTKEGISIDECSRLCLDEVTFECSTLIYKSSLRVCQWSSLGIYDTFTIEENINKGVLVKSKKDKTQLYYSNFE